jgi:hypothetical protein
MVIVVCVHFNEFELHLRDAHPRLPLHSTDVIIELFFFVFFRSTVIPGPSHFPLEVQLRDPFPCRVELIKDIQ